LGMCRGTWQMASGTRRVLDCSFVSIPQQISPYELRIFVGAWGRNLR
jgi:hypothetical protein